MNKPVILGAVTCGLLLVGLVLRPTFWSGGGTHIAGDPTPTAPLAVNAESPEWDRSPVRYETLSQTELRREADILWRRGLAIQTQLHRETTSDQRDILLCELENVVQRSNTVTALLDN